MQNLPVKLAASIVVLVCLGLGLVGLIVPVVPGLLFLALAALIGARHFPSLRRLLSRNPAIGRRMDRADRFLDLPPAAQLKVGGLFCLKLLLDAAALLSSALTKLVGLAAGPDRYGR